MFHEVWVLPTERGKSKIPIQVLLLQDVLRFHLVVGVATPRLPTKGPPYLLCMCLIPLGGFRCMGRLECPYFSELTNVQ